LVNDDGYVQVEWDLPAIAESNQNLNVLGIFNSSRLITGNPRQHQSDQLGDFCGCIDSRSQRQEEVLDRFCNYPLR
jgi:hypothetical protein